MIHVRAVDPIESEGFCSCTAHAFPHDAGPACPAKLPDPLVLRTAAAVPAVARLVVLERAPSPPLPRREPA